MNPSKDSRSVAEPFGASRFTDSRATSRCHRRELRR